MPGGYLRSTMTLAGLPRRALAFLIDGVIIGCPLLMDTAKRAYLPPQTLIGGNEVFGALFVSLALIAVNDWMLVAMRGQSIGKIILGIAVVDSDGETPNWGMAFARTFIRYGVAAVVTCAAPLWLLADGVVMLFDADRRTIHDRSAGTYVCRVADRRRASDE